MHNISNALAVIALGLELGIDVHVIRRALSTYQGAGRRIEVKFKNRDYLVIDDYAHHPTEIRATLSAIGSMQPNRLIVVFQPHRYTRTKLLLDEFTTCFDNADCVIVTDIYPASERPIAGVTGELLADSIRERLAKRDILFLPKARIISHIMSIMQPRDVIVTLGAGDIAKTCDELVERIKRQR
jgi:UDP-N-acetylmuramate--alanine ligase